MLAIYTGNGKGKTTASLGLIMRARGQNLKTAIVFFDKGGQDSAYGERKILRQLKIPFFAFGLDRRADGSFRLTNSAQDKKKTRLAALQAEKLLRSQKYDLVILDEFCSVCGRGLLAPEVADKVLFWRKGKTEIVLTGRDCPQKILKLADLVTEMKMKKHYFEKGVDARKGIEY